VTCVKICGITNLDDARCAVDAGADLLGFIFYPKSPRFTTPEQAAAIVHAVRSEFGIRGTRAPRCVGVFVNASLAHVRAVLDDVALDLAQLHGDEPVDCLRQLRPRAFKAIRPGSLAQGEAQASAYAPDGPSDLGLPQLLVDAYHPQAFGGTGLPVDLDIAGALAGRFRLLLAGGLTPETVGAVVQRVRPWGVDVSSGVEAVKGIKDHGKVRAFVRAVRGVERTEV